MLMTPPCIPRPLYPNRGEGFIRINQHSDDKSKQLVVYNVGDLVRGAHRFICPFSASKFARTVVVRSYRGCVLVLAGFVCCFAAFIAS